MASPSLMVICSFGASFGCVVIGGHLLGAAIDGTLKRTSCMQLEDLEIYQIAMFIGEKVWHIVDKWNYFAKDTIGKQLVKASDSIAANISEGYGRYHYKEARQFNYYARGSLFEARTWITKANNRGLLAQQDFEAMVKELDILGVKLNNFINSIGRQKRQSGCEWMI